jgi:hypothetical protein
VERPIHLALIAYHFGKSNAGNESIEKTLAQRPQLRKSSPGLKDDGIF